MVKAQDDHVYKGRQKPESFYHFITSSFISKPLVPILIKIGIRRPNTVSILSFILILVGSGLLLFLDQQLLMHRIVVALLIEVSFILDCSDGQMARYLNKTSLFGGWLDRNLDRIGEIILYTVIGYFSWIHFGNFLYFLLGSSTGFLFTYYSLIWAMKDSVFWEEIKRNNYELEKYFGKQTGGDGKKGQKILGKRFLKKNRFSETLAMLFFFLNIGIGERSFYPIFFILINRTDIMLVMVLVLFFMRSMNVTFLLIRQIKRNKIGIKLS